MAFESKFDPLLISWKNSAVIANSVQCPLTPDKECSKQKCQFCYPEFFFRVCPSEKDEKILTPSKIDFLS